MLLPPFPAHCALLLFFWWDPSGQDLLLPLAEASASGRSSAQWAGWAATAKKIPLAQPTCHIRSFRNLSMGKGLGPQAGRADFPHLRPPCEAHCSSFNSPLLGHKKYYESWDTKGGHSTNTAATLCLSPFYEKQPT